MADPTAPEGLSLAERLAAQLDIVEPGHRYTREHFRVDPTQFVGDTPAAEHAAALDEVFRLARAAADLLDARQEIATMARALLDADEAGEPWPPHVAADLRRALDSVTPPPPEPQP